MPLEIVGECNFRAELQSNSNEVQTRTNGITTWELSRAFARWKYNGGEDAAFLQLDEKTPEALL